MGKTKQQINDFLESQVGQKVNQKTGKYNGQCVSLIKALLEFLGAPDPYKGRGNAKDVGDTLIREGIARDGKGWLNISVSRTMGVVNGVTYGHVWVDVQGEANYEQNGARALLTTKNTRPLSQATQIINLDQYVAVEPQRKSNEQVALEVVKGEWGNGAERRVRLEAAGYNYNEVQAIVNGAVKPQTPARKSVDQIADEVIKGLWGNGQARKDRLASEGYSYSEVQAAVNRKL